MYNGRKSLKKEFLSVTDDGGVVLAVRPDVSLVQQLLLKLLVADVAGEDHLDVAADWLQHGHRRGRVHQGLS